MVKKRNEQMAEIYAAPASAERRGFFPMLLTAMLFFAAGAGIFYLYGENLKLHARIDTVAGNDALDRYIDRLTALQKLDVEEHARTLSLRMDERLDAARRTFAERAELEAFYARVEGVEAASRAGSGKSMAILSLAAVIKTNVEAGRAIGVELRVLEALLGGDIVFADDIATLRTAEVRRSISDIEMARLLERNAAEIAFAARHGVGEAPTWYDRLWLRAKGLVKMRNVNAGEGGSDSIVARAVAAADSGDFQEAHLLLDSIGARGEVADALAMKAAINSAASGVFNLAAARAAAAMAK